jgi:hypothetical protein
MLRILRKLYYKLLQSAFASNTLPEQERAGVGVSKAQNVPI